jgi:sodium-dependent dicarboxylate transporter 2/3/5
VTSGPSPRRFSPAKIGGVAAGVAAFVLIAFVDSPLHHVGEHGARPAYAAAVAALMAVWWLTEALPIHVTGCAPLVLFVPLGVFEGDAAEQWKSTVSPYFGDYVRLFAGGMCIGAAMQQWGLDRRIALAIMRAVGTEPKRLLFGFLAATATISMFISNTATAAMMVPIAAAVVHQLERRIGGRRLAGYGAAVMLSIAYAANIGGVGTKIGSPTNGQLCGVLQKLGVEVTFLQYSAVGVPFVALMLPIAWWVLWRVGRVDAPPRESGGETIAEESRKLGPVSRGERLVLCVFAMTALAWILASDIAAWLSTSAGAVKSAQIEGGVSLLAALVLIVARVEGRQAVGWAALRKAPWSTLLLLGGSFAIAAGIERSGLSDWLAAHLVALREMPPFQQVLVASAATVAISAVASNTATVSVLLPLLRNAVEPSRMTTALFASTIASSCDFALPAGTPPNAIVFGTGYVTIPRMVKSGVVLDAIAAVLAAAWTWVAVPIDL